MVERLVPVDDAELWLAEQGAGPPVMLCNGGPGCCDYLAPVAALIDDVARVYRFEQRGCGRSSHGGPYDLPTCLDDLEALRRALGHDRWIVGGHSWGANLALAYALTHPERLVFLEGAPHGLWETHADALRAELRAFLRMIAGQWRPSSSQSG